MYSSRYEGATGETEDGDNEANPTAPVGSRAYGSDFVHFIEDSQTGDEVIRFWFHEPPVSRMKVPLAIDYQILKSKIPWEDEKWLTLTPDTVAQLVCMVFFQELLEDEYQSKVTVLSYKAVDDTQLHDIPYPTKKITPQEIYALSPEPSGVLQKLFGLFGK